MSLSGHERLDAESKPAGVDRRSFMAGLPAALAVGSSPRAFARSTGEIDDVGMAYDYIVVGAGSAGCVIANRLSEDPTVSVLVIEAGGPDTMPEIHDPRAWPFLQGTSVDWGYTTMPQRHVDDRVLGYARGKVIGGSSAINAMGHQRGHPAIFDGWAEDNPGWSYNDLLPMFIKSENFSGGAGPYHGGSGPLGVLAPGDDLRSPVAASYLKAIADMGHPMNDDLNGAVHAGPCWNQVAVKDLKRQSTGVAYLDPIMGRPNLKVLTSAPLIKLDMKKTTCVGITYNHAGSPRQVLAKREVILSMGSIDTPKFLMLTGIGPAAALKQHGIPVLVDLAGVGQNLQDHPLLGGIVYEGRQPIPESKLNHGEGMYFTFSDSSRKIPDLLLMCVTLPFASKALPAVPSNSFTLVPALVAPDSRGSVTLASTDPGKSAAIDPNFFAADTDLTRILQAVDMAREIGASQGLGEWRLREVVPGHSATKADLRDFALKAAATFYHPVGTCKMGRDPMAVVDGTLRVHGVENLRVVDASIMPRITSAMPNASVIAIAEKAAMMIRGA
jgi:choline dehydrogenase